jgi:hypothetical protein
MAATDKAAIKAAPVEFPKDVKELQSGSMRSCKRLPEQA